MKRSQFYFIGASLLCSLGVVGLLSQPMMAKPPSLAQNSVVKPASQVSNSPDAEVEDGKPDKEIKEAKENDQETNDDGSTSQRIRTSSPSVVPKP